MPTTTNFGWTTPADTDYVTNGAAAMRTLGDGIDTSLLDLKGGTANQVLAKVNGSDLNFNWVTPAGYTLLSTTSLSGTSVNISSISQSYTDLVARIYLPTVTGAGSLSLRLNGNSSSVYAYISSQVSGTTVTTTGATAATGHLLQGTASTSSNFGYVDITITDYAQAITNKKVRSCSVNSATSLSVVTTEGTLRTISVAITSLTILTSATVFTGGTVYLYGVK